DLIKSSHEFGAEQLRIYEQRLASSEQLLERYKQSMIKSQLARAILPAANLGFAEALSRRIDDDAAMTRVRLKGYAESVERIGLRGDPEVILSLPGVRQMTDALTSALGNDVMNSLGSAAVDLENWPPPGSAALRRNLFRAIDMEVGSRYPELDDADRGAVSNYLFAKLDLRAQESAADVLQSSIGISKARVESTPSGEIELSRLEADVETNRRLLQSFQSQMVASDVSRAVEVTKLGMQIEILDPATLPLKPSHPNRRKILLASLLLGPMIGAGMAFLGEATDSTLRTLEDFARVVPEPILGATPLLSRLKIRRSWIRRHWVAVSVGAVILLALGLYAAREPLRRHVVQQGTPVKMVNPEKGNDADTR
ncbi:MAG: GNVR domain-containing protein, partial [Candidatus Eisenbacteria bacterium]|nr:GNVR domain-containing protein [Candidatus Eisenbacteria bacterium]